MWKPKDYQNPYCNDVNAPNYESGDIYCHDAYERGFDDCMEALLGSNFSIKNECVTAVCAKPYPDHWTISFPTLCHIAEVGNKKGEKKLTGTWVFIPEGE